MVEFRTLETFVWVAKLGSFRGAAAKLRTTQPAVSLRVAQLEGQLGARLFDRSRRAVALTERGRELIEHAERLLRLRSEMIHAIADRTAIAGTLRLGVSETIVHTWLPRFIERMSATYPRLALEIEVDISPNLRDRLLAQAVDLAFMVGPVSAPAIRSRPLCTFPVAFVASPALKIPKAEIPIAEMAAWPIITFARNTQPYVHIKEMLTGPRLFTGRIHASASLATIVRMALDGIGTAAIPPVIVTEELRTGRLVRIRTRPRIPDLQYVAGWLVTPEVGLIDAIADMAARVAALPHRGGRRVGAT